LIQSSKTAAELKTEGASRRCYKQLTESGKDNM
jgi:hypothetical protein